MRVVSRTFVFWSALACATPIMAQPASPAFTAEQLTAWPTDSWITNGGNVFNQRYSPLDQINRETVGRLEPVWRTSLNGSGLESKYSGQAQALFYEGVIYIATGPVSYTHLRAHETKTRISCCVLGG